MSVCMRAYFGCLLRCKRFQPVGKRRETIIGCHPRGYAPPVTIFGSCLRFTNTSQLTFSIQQVILSLTRTSDFHYLTILSSLRSGASAIDSSSHSSRRQVPTLLVFFYVSPRIDASRPIPLSF